MARVSENLKNPFDKGEGEGKEPDVKETEGEGVEVKLKSDDDEDEDDEDESESSDDVSTREAAPRESSRQRRVNKYKAEKEGRERAEARIRELEMERVAQRVVPTAPQPQGPSLDEHYTHAMDQIYEQKRALAKQHSDLVSKGALTEDLEKLLWSRHRDLETQTNRVNTQYAQLSNPANNPGYQQQSEQQRMVANWLQMEHPDVISHPNARAIGLFAAAEEVRLIQSGAPRDMQTARKAIEAAKLHFGLSRRPAPSQAHRQRYAGGTSSAGAGGGSPNGGSPTHLTLTKAQQSMAEARYADLKPNDAYKKWANGPGRQMLANRKA